MANKPTVYIETTIPSFLTARPSGDLIAAGRQLLTRQWWEKNRLEYDLFVSEIVLDESGKGDPNAARLRLDVLEGLPLLKVDEPALVLTRAILKSGVIPGKAAADAGHVAVAVRYGMDFLLTWNCAHIANAAIWAPLSDLVQRDGYRLPIICTPDELLAGGQTER